MTFSKYLLTIKKLINLLPPDKFVHAGVEPECFGEREEPPGGQSVLEEGQGDRPPRQKHHLLVDQNGVHGFLRNKVGLQNRNDLQNSEKIENQNIFIHFSMVS